MIIQKIHFKLRPTKTTFSAKINSDTKVFKTNIDTKINHIIPVGDYCGDYVITPTQETQILPTSLKSMDKDIIINPIPSNYGRIDWNGAYITVS